MNKKLNKITVVIEVSNEELNDIQQDASKQDLTVESYLSEIIGSQLGLGFTRGEEHDEEDES